MKKKKLLTALLLYAVVVLQANAENVSDWQGVVNAFVNGGEITLTDDIQTPVLNFEEPDKQPLKIQRDKNVTLDLGGHAIIGPNEAIETGLISPSDFEPDSSLDTGKVIITNGTIKGFSGESVLENYTKGIIKELSVDFAENKSDFGGAIFNITHNSNKAVDIDGISGSFKNNEAKYWGGAILNAVMDMKVSNDWYIPEAVKSGDTAVINILTKNKDVVFSGNKAGIIGGAIVNTGVVNINAANDNKVIFETKSDDIYNIGTLNIKSGNTIVNSSISNQEVQEVSYNITDDDGTSITFSIPKMGGDNYGITNISDGATLTLGNDAAITQKEINVSGTLDGTNGGKITGALKISNTGAANLKASNLTSAVSNDGSLTLQNGTLSQNINGNGTTAILGEVTNNAQIKQAVEIQSGKLTSNSDNINSVKIGSGATYNVIGGALKNITGGGSLLLSGDYTSAALTGFTGDVNIAQGKTLTVGSSLFNNNTLAMANGSTLSLLGEAKDTTIDKLAIASGDTVNLKFDWGDTLNSTSSEVKGSFNVNEINLASTDGTEKTYTFTTTLADKVALANDITLSNVTSSTNNFVTYNNTNGELFSKRKTLSSAVDETASSETNTYVMTGNESAGNETLTGSLTVQGNGNTIKDGGITVGDGTTTNSVLTLKDVNIDGVKVEGGSQGAIHVNGGNELNLVAETGDVKIQGSTGNSNSAIYLQKDSTNGIAKATINAQGGTITISDDIMSDDKDNQVVFTGNKNIKFSGKFDPVLATVNMSGSELERGGQDIDIDWNLNGGTLRYTNDNYLSGATNSLNFNGGSLDLRNGAVNTVNLAALTLSNNSNLYLDADLAKETMDKFYTENVSVNNTSAKLHVAGFNLISDATKDQTTINFVPKETNLAGYVDYTGAQGLTALSPIYKYNVAYDKTNGDFSFTRFAGGSYDSYNPAIMASPIAAQLGGYLTQLNSYDEAFRNMDMYMLMTKKQREAMKLRNKYAALDSNLVFDPTGTSHDDKAVWVRPYATFENVPLKGGPKVSNVAYGSFFGGESEIYDLGHGWDGIYGVYAGYNGSHQAYNGIGMYQNGGTLGLVGMVYKGNFFNGLTINAGANVGEASTIYGTDDFTMLMAGIADKTGYNWELADGKFIIQPNFQMSYSFVNTFDYTNAAGVRMDSDPLNVIQLEPGIKFIGNLKNGWQPYAGVSVVWNIIDKTKFCANNVSLPELSIKPYVRYGAGVRKTWGDRLTGFFQTYITNGGRNGVGLQAGFIFTLGKAPSDSRKATNSTPKLPKAQINLSSAK